MFEFEVAHAPQTEKVLSSCSQLLETHMTSQHGDELSGHTPQSLAVSWGLTRMISQRALRSRLLSRLISSGSFCICLFIESRYVWQLGLSMISYKDIEQVLQFPGHQG